MAEYSLGMEARAWQNTVWEWRLEHGRIHDGENNNVYHGRECTAEYGKLGAHVTVNRVKIVHHQKQDQV